jgi:hypothetical protein
MASNRLQPPAPKTRALTPSRAAAPQQQSAGQPANIAAGTGYLPYQQRASAASGQPKSKAGRRTKPAVPRFKANFGRPRSSFQ